MINMEDDGKYSEEVEVAETHPYFSFGIDRIVGDWVAEVLEMDSDLMG
jgi:hypothetical protein